MRLATFNVENLFERAVALNQSDWLDAPGRDPSRWSAGRAALDAHARLNALLRKASYSKADKTRIIELLEALGLKRSDESKLVLLRQNRGKLVKRPRGGGLEIVAHGRGDWIGWLDLKTEAVNEVATQNTAQVLRDVNADVVALVEAEHRISLARFNAQVLKSVGGTPYETVMLIDGNDDRGIDVGLLTRPPITLDTLRSHVNDRAGTQTIFSRDCPEYALILPGGERLVVLVNHLKSKGFGTAAESNAKRLTQAIRIREIYDRLRGEGVEHVLIAGDLNDTPGSAPLAPLLGAGSDLRDISAHPSFDDGGRPGTYANGTKGNKIDYLLMSPALFARVTAGGIFRKGVWGGKNGRLWEIYPEMTAESEAASDHAAVWADVSF